MTWWCIKILRGFIATLWIDSGLHTEALHQWRRRQYLVQRQLDVLGPCLGQICLLGRPRGVVLPTHGFGCNKRTRHHVTW
jgi:hypothetical protein